MKNRNIFIILVCVFLSLSILSSCAMKDEKSDEGEDDSIVKTLDLDGRKMDYFRFGNKDGRKIILLPGLSWKSVMGSAEAVAEAYALLAEDYDIYLLDHIKEEPEGYSINDMAEDTYLALKMLGLDRVNFMGVSLGGMIVEILAIEHPEIAESIALCSTASRLTDDSKDLFKSWKKLAEEKDTNSLMVSFGENIYTPSIYEQYKDTIIASGQGASEIDYNNFIISADAIINFDIYDEIDQIKCPVFVLGAGKDKVLGVEASFDIIDKLNCEYFIYEDSGHGVYDEAPDYLERIKEFLEKTG